MTTTSTPGDLTDAVIVVGLLTYRRPDRLSRMLPQVVEQAAQVAEWSGGACSVLVVDNDPAASAQGLVHALATTAPVPLRYVCEPTPGIAAARRRVMAEVAGADFLQFIDDDEEPAPDWLALMLGTWREHARPAAVAGSIRPRYLAPPEEFVLAGEFFERAQYPTGTPVRAAPTSNLLLDLRQVREVGVEFDTRLGMRGGEDTLFTRQLTRAGRRIVFCREAVVYDLVPAERSNREWALNRARHHGSGQGHLALLQGGTGLRRLGTRACLAGGGAARMVRSGAQAVVGRLTGNHSLEAKGLHRLQRAVGIFSEAFGGTEAEYARPTKTESPAPPDQG